jgi:hypothetical protein
MRYAATEITSHNNGPKDASPVLTPTMDHLLVGIAKIALLLFANNKQIKNQ